MYRGGGPPFEMYRKLMYRGSPPLCTLLRWWWGGGAEGLTFFAFEKQKPSSKNTCVVTKMNNQHFERRKLNIFNVFRPQERQNRIRCIRNIQIDTSKPAFRLNVDNISTKLDQMSTKCDLSRKMRRMFLPPEARKQRRAPEKLNIMPKQGKQWLKIDNISTKLD